MQATENLNGTTESQDTNTSHFHSLYKPITEELENQLIAFDWILKYPYQYQAMLMQIADYLIDGNWWEEKENGILFF